MQNARGSKVILKSYLFAVMNYLQYRRPYYNCVAPDNRENADDVLNTAERVLEALKLAADAQAAARDSIANAEAEIENADRDLVEVTFLLTYDIVILSEYFLYQFLIVKNPYFL